MDSVLREQISAILRVVTVELKTTNYLIVSIKRVWYSAIYPDDTKGFNSNFAGLKEKLVHL